jgi:DNA primase
MGVLWADIRGMSLPPGFLDELRNRVSISQVVGRKVVWDPRKSNQGKGDMWAPCPFHQEKSASFHVDDRKGFYHCFGCGAHGTAISFLMEYSGLGFIDAIKDLAGRAGMQLPEQEGRQQTNGPKLSSLTEIMADAARYYYEQLKRSEKAIGYLKERGVSGEVAQKFGIGYAPDGWQNLGTVFEDYTIEGLQQAGMVIKNEKGRLYDRFRDRIMFPIMNQKGEIIAFGGRVLGEGEPKYLNSPETPLFEKGREVFGLPQARSALREKNTAIVVEGYMDVVALAQHGIGNVVATLGTATTATHVQKLLRQVDRIVYCFDGDSAGKKAAWRALENSLEALPEQKSIGFVFLPEKDDPDSFVRNQGKEAFERMITQAVPLSEFLLRELSSRCDMTSAEGRAKLVSEAKPLLGRLQTPLLRLQLVKRLSEASGFSQSEVERLCDLRPVARAAPARAPQKAPSLLRPLLRLLLQKPELAKETPYKSLPENVAEARAVKQLCEAILASEVAIPTYNALLERLRGSEDEAALREAAAELMQQPFAEEDIDAEFQGVIQKLLEAERKRAFARLQEKVNKLGAAGLSSEEKQQYLQALAFKR